jgi:hypothetical protein
VEFTPTPGIALTYSAGVDMPDHRLLFASTHSYLDLSSGAALATRELLELITSRGWDCRALTCGVLDYQEETPLENVLASMDLPATRVGATLSRDGKAAGLRPRRQPKANHLGPNEPQSLCDELRRSATNAPTCAIYVTRYAAMRYTIRDGCDG